MATAKKAAKKSPKKAAKKAAKNAAPKKAAKKTAKKTAKKSSPKKNKLGVENSLVNNINARKKKGASRPKSKKTVDKKSYDKMEEGWNK